MLSAYPEVEVRLIEPESYELTSPGPLADAANKLLNDGWFYAYNAPDAGKDLAFTITNYDYNPEANDSDKLVAIHIELRKPAYIY